MWPNENFADKRPKFWNGVLITCVSHILADFIAQMVFGAAAAFCHVQCVTIVCAFMGDGFDLFKLRQIEKSISIHCFNLTKC